MEKSNGEEVFLAVLIWKAFCSIHIGLKAVFKLRFYGFFERGGHIERAADLCRLRSVISRFKGKVVCRAKTFIVIAKLTTGPPLCGQKGDPQQGVFLA